MSLFISEAHAQTAGGGGQGGGGMAMLGRRCGHCLLRSGVVGNLHAERRFVIACDTFRSAWSGDRDRLLPPDGDGHGPRPAEAAGARGRPVHVDLGHHPPAASGLSSAPTNPDAPPPSPEADCMDCRRWSRSSCSAATMSSMLSLEEICTSLETPALAEASCWI